MRAGRTKSFKPSSIIKEQLPLAGRITNVRYCSLCGATVSRRIPRGDNVMRHVCDECETVHYQNPKVVAGCIVTWQDRILLCKRAIEPRYGLWTIPAGFMELGETVQAAAARETMEEACAAVEIDHLFAVYNIPHVSQVYIIFQAHLEAPDFAPGAESLATELYLEDEIPWDELAFPVVRAALKRFYENRSETPHRPYVGDIIR